MDMTVDGPAAGSRGQDAPIEGSCAGGWEKVEEVFRNSFATRGELGAGLCVMQGGEVVVDLAGGWSDESKARSFSPNDLTLVFSTTKAMTALTAHVLAHRGLLDLNAPVAHYWPEYAANGKAATTVAMLLNHSAGVPGFREPLKPEAYLDPDYMANRIAAEAPFWEPGTHNGYHLMNFGWMVGEVVRRVSGRTLGSYFRDEIAKPLNADFWIGLPEAEQSRVVDLTAPPPPKPGDPMPEILTNLFANPTSTSALAVINGAGFSPDAVDEASGALMMNSRKAHAVEIGAAGGVGNARGVAKVYASLGSDDLLSRDYVAKMSQTASRTMRDAVLLIPTHFALGFMKSMDNRDRPFGDIESFIIGESAFGHVGMGGSFGFYDRDADLAVGYTMNRLGSGILVNPRGQALIDAAYSAAGYRTNTPGVWIR